MTKQKLAILDLLQAEKKHWTAEEVFLKTKQSIPKIAMGTVYNNLNALTEEGKIRRIKVPGAPDLFDGNVIPHQHIFCGQCGKVFDVDLTDTLKSLERQLNVPLTSYDITFKFLCADCGGKDPSHIY